MNSRFPLAASFLALLAACGMAADPPSDTAAAARAAEHDAAPLRPGAVFTQTNDPAKNAVLAFARRNDGTLEPAGAFGTGGTGTGAGLGSQGAVALSGNGRFLFAVNAGSNEVSSFRVDGARLTPADIAPSGGTRPVSVTAHDDLVYVVNAGGGGSISGFRVNDDGTLHPLSGSTRPGATAPGQISFDPSGETLVVTDKATNTLDLYGVGDDGRAEGPRQVPSSGPTPFGFAFTRRGVLVVSEAFGGAADASAVSSYVLEEGALELRSGSVPTTQTAACWVAVTGSGRYAFAANAGSSSISSYRIDGEGRLELLAGAAGTLGEGGRPLDVAVSRGDRYLYALDAGRKAIHAFAVDRDGGLSPLGPAAIGLPPFIAGIAAR